jgi:hypothetical protein
MTLRSTNHVMSNNPYNDAMDLFIMSVYKPDPDLRTEAYENGCYTELMQIREDVLEYLTQIRRDSRRFTGE